MAKNKTVASKKVAVVFDPLNPLCSTCQDIECSKTMVAMMITPVNCQKRIPVE